ncbi:hypothetical protein LCGC14_2693470, partial [marine sediment metagenome]
MICKTDLERKATEMPFKQVELVINYKVRFLCTVPYPNHRKGCPNYNQRKSCPPNCKKIEDLIYTDSVVVYAIWSVFNFGFHVKKMEQKHPDWSRRQLECCLYWQGTARKRLHQEIEMFLKKWNKFSWLVICTPEACGVDITATMKKIGYELEWPPKNITYQVAVAGLSKPPRKVNNDSRTNT